MDGPKIGVMSSWSELPLPSVLRPWLPSTLRDSLTWSQGYTGAVEPVVEKRGGYGARGDSVLCIILTVREDTI